MLGKVRLLSEKDLEEAANIFASVFRDMPWNEPWSYKTSYKRLLDISLTPGYIGVGYFDFSNGGLLGFLMGNEEQWADTKSFYINEICVLNNIQHSGIGTSLLEYLKHILESRSVHEAYLSTEKGNAKPELFFKRNGFSTNESRILMSVEIGN
ncbi:GNAT family N-acetyltransferase [Priestia megaterium]|uniref:GNAT family N-acetyltransferase n=1 Tax=Priestia megaterium TaxID=1404 RepID=UPI002E1A645E|nr:GNAT family N-acetyltransferase [Priestia megaterium]